VSDDTERLPLAQSVDEWVLESDRHYQRRRRKKVEAAAYIILTARDGKDPYIIDNHLSIKRGNFYDCPEESIWDDDADGLRLLPEEALRAIEVAPGCDALECPACWHQYEMWSDVIEATGAAEYGDRVFYALNLIAYIEEWGDRSGITLEDWNDLEIVKRKIRQIEEHARYEASKPKSS
jgi:hypothetical protein